MSWSDKETEVIMDIHTAALGALDKLDTLEKRTVDQEDRLRQLETWMVKHMEGHRVWGYIAGVFLTIVLPIITFITTGWF